MVGGNATGNFWGAYQADHTYVATVTGQGTTVRGWYSDIPGYYGDNSGTLTVQIYREVATAIDDPELYAGDPLVVRVLDNDAIPTGSGVTVAIVRGPSYGSVGLNPDQTILYTGTNDSPTRTDSFIYSITDAAGRVSTATVYLLYAPVMDDVPVLFQAQPPPPEPGFKQITEVFEIAFKSKAVEQLAKEFVRNGGSTLIGDTKFGGHYDPVNKIITLDPERTHSAADAASIFLFELLRANYTKGQLDLEESVRKGRLKNKADFVEACERHAYELVKLHHEIAEAAVKAGQWPPQTDRYRAELFPNPPGRWTTFEGYFKSAKETGHTVNLEKIFDDLREKKR